MNVTGKQAQLLLDEVNITSNKNGIPYDPESPFVTSGIRLGTPAVTTRGMDEKAMYKIAEFIHMTITDFDNNKEAVIKGVADLLSQYPLYN